MGEITPPKAVPGLAEQISEKTSGFIHSRKHRDLLDIVDALRSNVVSHYVNLPQVIVCGSQSSGKSSTLESFSGIAFPTAEGLCTRFATEVILRRSEKSETKVQIQLSASRSEEERVKLLKFHEKETDQKYFAKIIEAAKIEMGLTGTGPNAKVFSIDILRIESTSPTAPNLTLVDLPGLFSASNKNQHAFANQPVTKFAREIDPSGIRTLGLITKPDKIDRGSDTEKYYIELAQNNNVKLSLGWHVLRDKSHATADDTITKREDREAAFYADSDWTLSIRHSLVYRH
ncbi:related to Mx2 protein (GTPase protein) [Rhynchosporium agropyri]|uniref:Related to Mx2 protein (GTPase protein) n=1 Tax=Rhynchosporium agropyri TaxID=914238 RepID=A0A1E1KL55_9HELO|nr:related to Mx2 protein (GTPase protein) [Rhynchosporium agropyri]